MMTKNDLVALFYTFELTFMWISITLGLDNFQVILFNWLFQIRIQSKKYCDSK